MKLFFLRHILLFTATCLIIMPGFADSNLSTYEIKKLLRHKIASVNEIAVNPQIIAEVQHRNQLGLSLETIRKIDSEWKSYSDDHPVKLSMHTSKAGLYLRSRVEADDSIFSEIFLTGKQGANITAWPITTDYWQGDEAKWNRSFNNGRGDIHIGNLEFDESSQYNAIQVSVPIMDNGVAIGVLIAGIKISYIQAKYLNARFKN